MSPGKQPPASKNTWEELLADMKPGRSGNESAVHKPLLVLLILAQAQRGGPNEFFFENLAPYLDDGIHRFGTAQQPGGSEMPFWHLKNDGFWVVENEDALPRRSQGDRPLKSGLLGHKAKAHVPPELWADLAGDRQLIEKLAVQVLTRHWPQSEHGAILKHVGLEVSEEARARAGMLRQGTCGNSSQDDLPHP
jgi:putative restriction endonuclease